MPLFSLHIYYNPSTILIQNFKALAVFYGCTARIVLGLVGNPKDRFSLHRSSNDLAHTCINHEENYGLLDAFYKITCPRDQVGHKPGYSATEPQTMDGGLKFWI